MKYLSIFEDSYECIEFLRKYDFLPQDFSEDDDLLRMFEGNPDVLTEEELFDKSLTNVGEAIKYGAFFCTL